VKALESLVEYYTELLGQSVMPPTALEGVLHEAAKRAGWTPPSSKAQRRQQVAAAARKQQRYEDMAVRRIFVAALFKQLRPGLRAKPSSLGTAQAIIRRLDEFQLGRMPPMTVRTIQEDIRFMRENGNFGI